MESIWPAIFAFLGVFALAIISPGPNFILVTNTALNRSRSEGVWTAAGVATGSGIFALAGLAGLLPLVHSLPHFTLLMRFVGGGYLAWIGLDMLRTCRRAVVAKAEESRLGTSAMVPYRAGMLTNLTNPKAWAFYLSLFTLVMEPAFPMWGKLFLNISMFLISLAWYVAMACLVSSKTFQPLFLSWRPLIQGVLGVLLLIVSGKILLG